MTLEQPLMGRRITIRSYRREDLDFCTGMWFDPENGKYMSDPEAAFVDERFQRALDGLQDAKDGYYLIAEEQGERIGTCCAFPDEAGKVWEIGYCVRKDLWRQGFGREIVETLSDWIRERGGTAITAEAARENAASCGLLERCGFRVKEESVFQKYHMDVRFDAFIFEKKL